MAVFNKFNSFVEALAKKQHNLATDTFKALLTNTAPVAANTVPADIAEIAAGGGYLAGGLALTVTQASQAAGIFTWKISDATLTATGNVATFRYAAVYNLTAGLLVGWIDRGAAASPIVGDTIVIDFTDGDVVFTLA